MEMEVEVEGPRSSRIEPLTAEAADLAVAKNNLILRSYYNSTRTYKDPNRYF